MSNVNNNNEANVIGAAIIATSEGKDPEYDIVGLMPGSMYFRIDNGEGGFNYIEAGKISQSLKSIDSAMSSKADSSVVEELKNDLEDGVESFNTQIKEIHKTLDDKVDLNDYDADMSLDKSKFASKSDLNALKTQVNSKIDASYLEPFKDEVIEAISGDPNDPESEQSTVVGSIKVNVRYHSKKIAELENLIKSLENNIDDTTDEDVVELINVQIESLKNEIQKELNNKASAEYVDNAVRPVKTDLESLTARVKIVSDSLNKKATNLYVQNEISTVNDTISELRSAVNSKASVDQLSRKASKDELTVVSDKVNRISNTVNKLSNVENDQKLLAESLKTKADTSDVETLKTNMTAALSNKADIVDVNRKINGLDTRVTTLENADNVEDFKESISSLSNDIKTVERKFDGLTNTQKSKLDSHDKQIENLKITDNDIKQQLKHEWIRIMTPEEYNRLPIKPTYSDGSKNPNALQPNVIYFLVKYNKPYALYIGSTLIAKTEEKIGSQGFTYTFPIVF